jgi:hypothetical protein
MNAHIEYHVASFDKTTNSWWVEYESSVKEGAVEHFNKRKENYPNEQWRLISKTISFEVLEEHNKN